MIKELVTDESLLSTPCEKATAEDETIAADLAETLESLEDAACLAANQIGETKCIVAYRDDKDGVHVMFNPTMQRALGAFKTVEGCLTREEETKVTRYTKITVKYEELADGELKPRKKEFSDWPAQIIQHMIDHCKGKLI